MREGLSFRLNNGRIAAGPASGIFELAGADGVGIPRYIDVALTESLATQSFIHRGGFPGEWKHWPDVATEQIIDIYAMTLQILAYVHASRGDTRRADELNAMAVPFQTLASRRAGTSR